MEIETTEEFEKRNFWRKKYGQQPYFCAEMESQFHFLRNEYQNISNRAKNSAISPPLENAEKSNDFSGAQKQSFKCFAHQKINYAKFPTVSRLVLDFANLYSCSKTSVWNNLVQLKEIGILHYGDVKNKGIPISLTEIGLMIARSLKVEK